MTRNLQIVGLLGMVIMLGVVSGRVVRQKSSVAADKSYAHPISVGVVQPDPALRPVPAIDNSAPTHQQSVAQQAGAGATVRTWEIDTAPRSLASRVRVSQIIAKVQVTAVDPGLFNTLIGDVPTIPLSPDPQVDDDPGWDIHSRAQLHVLHLYDGPTGLQEIVIQELGGTTAGGHVLIVKGVSDKSLTPGTIAMVFGTTYPVGRPPDGEPWIDRGFDLVDQLRQAGAVAEFMLLQAGCVYAGDQAGCVEDMKVRNVVDLETQVDALTP